VRRGSGRRRRLQTSQTLGHLVHGLAILLLNPIELTPHRLEVAAQRVRILGVGRPSVQADEHADEQHEQSCSHGLLRRRIECTTSVAAGRRRGERRKV